MDKADTYRQLIDLAVERGSVIGLRAALEVLEKYHKDEALRIISSLIAEQEKNESGPGAGHLHN